MNLQEVFNFLGISGNYHQQCEQYAELLDSGQKNVPVADELVGDAYSSNGKCVWHKKKAFINQYKHGVSFELISRVFEDPLPDGYRILDEVPDTTSAEDRDRVLAVIPPNHYVVVKLDVKGNLVRLITAQNVDHRMAKRFMNQGLVQSSKSVIRSILFMYDDNGNEIEPLPANLLRFFRVHDLFVSGEFSFDDAMNVLIFGLDMFEDDAITFMESWQHEKKNIDYLAGQMSRL